MTITISDRRDIQLDGIIDLYRANKWSSADKPNGICARFNSSNSIESHDRSRFALKIPLPSRKTLTN